MVDLSEIQAAYYMVAATGVLVAAVFYIMNLREQRRNARLTLETRKIGLIDSLQKQLISEDGMRNYFELMNYEWRDYDDFEHKYGSDFNVNAAAKRYNMYSMYNEVGALLKTAS